MSSNEMLGVDPELLANTVTKLQKLDIDDNKLTKQQGKQHMHKALQKKNEWKRENPRVSF